MSSGLAPSRSVLPNGVVLLSRRTRATPSVTINIALRAGSVCDPADATGAMYLLSKLIDRGTTTRSVDDIAEALDGRGISLGVTVTRHLFSFICTCLADDFADVMALLADLIQRPALPESELITRKGEVVTTLRQDEDNPGVRATEALMELLYPAPHPYGRRSKGTIAIVEELNRHELAALHAARFAPCETSVVVVGDVDPDEAKSAVALVFGGWSANNPPAVPVSSPPVPARRRRLVIPMMNKAQADIAYGFT